MIFDRTLLENRTAQIINDPTDVNSSVFADIYNEVYKSCTMPNKKHEILGRDIYNMLTDILNKYTQEIKPFNSINEAIAIFNNYKQTIKMIQMAYKYLERYFIKVSLEQRDGYVMDIKTLSLTFFYRNYLEKNVKKFTDIFRLELNNIKSIEDNNVVVLRRCLQFFREVFDRNDETKKFKNIIDCFVTHYLSIINLKGYLFDVSREIIRALKISRCIFEPFYFHTIERKFIAKVADRKKEFVNLLIDSFESETINSFYYNAIVLLNSLDKLHKSFAEAVPKKIGYVLENRIPQNQLLKCLYKEYDKYSKYILKFCNEDKNMIKILENSYRTTIPTCYEDLILKFINLYVISHNTTKLKKLINFVNVINISAGFNENLLKQTQKRLVFRQSSYVAEEVLFKTLNEEKFLYFFSKAERCLNDIKKNEKSLALVLNNDNEHVLTKSGKSQTKKPEQNNKILDVNLALVNSCFFNLKPDEKPECNETIQRIINLLLADLRKQHKQKIIHINYSMSPVIVEINGMEVKVSLNMYTILDMIDNAKAIKKTELIDALRLKDNNEIEKLCSANVIVENCGLLQINHNLAKNIDLFEEIYDENAVEKAILQPQMSNTINFESKIMQIAKREKLIKKEKLLAQFEERDYDGISAALEALVEKEFVATNGDYIEYIP